MSEKVAAITGGNSGIGRAIAQKFLQEGYKVAVLGRNQETLDETKSLLNNEALLVQGDVSSLEDIDRFYSSINQKWGRLDVVVANAGVSRRIPTQDVTEEDFDWMFSINAKGAYFTAQKAIPYLKPGSSVVFISSISSRLGVATHGIYSGTKAAVDKFSDCFAAEFAESRGIRFNVVSPGYTETPIFEKAIELNSKFIEETSERIPMKRFAKPEEIAEAVYFLSSEKGCYICGHNLVVDGAFSSTYPIPAKNL